MRKILIVLIVGLILLNGCIPQLESTTKAHPCDSKEYNEALEELDVTLCELVPNMPGSSVKYPYYDNYCRELCIGSIAYEKRNPKLCELINNFKDIPHVKGWDDPRETGSYKDNCYIHLASKLNNISLCENVETDWAKEYCPQLGAIKP